MSDKNKIKEKKKAVKKGLGDNDYDFIIIGAGGTGLAAAMYAARLGLKTLVLGASHGSELPVGGVITTTNVVENYPGFIRLTGTELADKIREHAESYDLVEIKEEKVEKVSGKANRFIVKTKKNEYIGKTILFATGTKWRKLPESVKGAREFEGRGINFCALCQPLGEDIVSNSNLVQIEKITPDTRVLTKEGDYARIGGFTRTQFKGDLIKITPRFFTEPVKLTPNHPVLTIKVDRGKSINYKKDPDFSDLEWKEASDLTLEDNVVYPIIKEVLDKELIKLSDFLELREEDGKVIPHKETHTAIRLNDDIKLDKELMRLFGYYLAEGSSVRHELKFYFHRNEREYIEDVSKILEKSFGLKPHISYRDNVGIISVYSKPIADLFKILFDKIAHSKKIPHFIMLLPKEKQKELIKGLWRGDGCIREKDFCLTTSSKKMAYQVRDLLLRQGIIPSVQIRKKEDLNKKVHKIEGREVSFTKDKYHLTVGGQFLDKMSEVLGEKHPKIDSRVQTLKHAWITNEFAILPIRNTEKEKYEGDVLSISVEGSQSYVTKGFVVHNCDGPLFKNKIVSVIGGSDSAAKDALVLAEHAKKVYIIYRGEKIRPEPVNLLRVQKNKKIEIINNTNVFEIKGKQFVESVILDKEYKGSKELKMEGVFVAIGHDFLSELAVPLGVKLNEKKEIVINHKDSSTNVPGVYAAGDVADKPFKQAITGVAEGCTAAHSAYEFISKEGIETS